MNKCSQLSHLEVTTVGAKAWVSQCGRWENDYYGECCEWGLHRIDGPAFVRVAPWNDDGLGKDWHRGGGNYD